MSTGTITCVDGSVVVVANECLNGVGATPIVGLTSINSLAGRLLSTAKADVSSLLGNAQAISNLPTQLSPKTTAVAIIDANPTALLEISKLMLAGVSTSTPVINLQTNAAVLEVAAGGTMSIVATMRKASNAAENLFNQLINGSPTSIVLSTPIVQLPPMPALGIA